MRHDYEWHRAQVRRQRREGRNWDTRPQRAPRPRGPWLALGVMAAIGLATGLVIAHGLSVEDRRGYEHLLTGVDLVPPGPTIRP
ncbi:MAG: hypothetical protein JWN66_182 [Sphingomonas bacterium]|nr:hypothetical protein [Sphingomonas bacterium]